MPLILYRLQLILSIYDFHHYNYIGLILIINENDNYDIVVIILLTFLCIIIIIIALENNYFNQFIINEDEGYYNSIII